MNNKMFVFILLKTLLHRMCLNDVHRKQRNWANHTQTLAFCPNILVKRPMHISRIE